MKPPPVSESWEEYRRRNTPPLSHEEFMDYQHAIRKVESYFGGWPTTKENHDDQEAVCCSD